MSLVLTGQESQEQLAQLIKDLQRGNADAKEQWIAYTDIGGQRTRDPTKHTAEFLRAFIFQLQSGAKIPMHEDAGGLAEIAKLMIKKSLHFKSIWVQFTQQFGGSEHDPAKHQPAFFVKFFDYLAQQACTSVQVTAAMTGVDPTLPPFKRMRTGKGEGIAVATGDPVKDELVLRIKSFQRMGEAQKELWAAYADLHLGGVRDPGRHDTATLQEFCDNHNVPQLDPVEAAKLGKGAVAGIPGLAAYGVLGAAVGTMPTGGPVPTIGHALGPTIGPMAAPLVGPMVGPATGVVTAPPAIVDADAAKVELVDKVKAFQRASKEQADVWKAFSGALLDPARHEVAKLLEFCALYNIH